mmetsp:Transcript_5238/g.9607  ORF Transcript_5238/g.9607 Transcript_5238/m.9607 type:complete len:404 (+) Transcript_5238:2049-3260(+)|eukprot:CAMPEP_0204912814 /NCGR_PEP_ID=MMETSP1397-20131031/10897_1 /ASSEMBLY_ACC=CAM_ASM_000891 /TAXON_ID=49980 /ORGANISM="Climacostomum Climacostomum virens, Strain Stock W-24" /LENGTH=403 /DNA_ID=CAMNT_0052083919 /DNA_START=862 /DNA_END=2073 /DNA_ORIENTATION=+
MEDRFGYLINCGSVQSLAVLNEWLRRETNNIEWNLEEAKLVEDCTLMKILLAERTLWQDTTDAYANARVYLDQARSMPMNERERMWFEIVSAWDEQRDEDQVAGYIRLIEAYPRDAACTKQGIHHVMRLGKQPLMMKFVDAMLAVPENLESSEVHSFIAFAYIENFNFEEGLKHATRAFEIDPTNSWAQHNIAHCHASYDRFEQAREILVGRQETWRNKFMFSHCSWHYGVYNLILDDTEEAMTIYHRDLLGRDYWHFLNRFHMLSFLMYLDLLGEDISELFPQRLVDDMLCKEKWTRDRLVDLLSVWGLLKTGHVSEATELCKLGDLGDVWDSGVKVMTYINSGDRTAAAIELEPILKKTCLFGSSFQKRHTISDCCLLTRRHVFEEARKRREEQKRKALCN